MSLQTQLEIRQNAQKLKCEMAGLSEWLKDVKTEKPVIDVAGILKKATELKEEGNTLVRSGDHPKAESKYSLAIEVLSSVSQTDSRHLSAQIHLNRALCFLQLSRDKEAVKDCVQSFKLNPSGKALYRKSCAEAKLGHLDVALSDINRAIKLVPEGDSNARTDCENQLKAVKALKDANEVKKLAESRRRLCAQIPMWCRDSPREPLIKLEISGIETLETISPAVKPPSPILPTGPRYIPRSERMFARPQRDNQDLNVP
jgi:tetratricopeptide (TPR) repeat protein